MKRKFVLLMLATLLCGSCDTSDNVTQIFVSGTWYLVDYYTDANWGKRNGTPKYNRMAADEETAEEGKEALQVIQQFTVNFLANGMFTGRMQYGTLSGTWEADGNKRTIRIVNESEYESVSEYDEEFIAALQNVAIYQGDTNVLLLAPTNKKSYMQFRHK